MNIASYIILALIIAVCAAIAVKGIINRKNGKGGCSCGCGGCAMADKCHPKKDENGGNNA
ncbi:MAG: FeoB-associated Cys-rich membrane protein [Clostridia bacterium]|nr:FeoB-associated Cys-rich membrane protein [Clostridia bacterium]